MRRRDCLALPLGWCATSARAGGRLEHHSANASRHVLPRDVRVWLPPGYGGQRRHPVLYLHDGQHQFSGSGMKGGWRADEAALQLIERGDIAPLILVAVAHGADRIGDYTPVAMQREGRTMGGSAPAYARFLVEELKPFIDHRYRTLPGAQHTALGGSSLAGLATMWLLLQHPQTFGAGLVVSPSVWWGGEAILRDVAAASAQARRARVWLDIGLAEGDEAVAGARRLAAALRGQGWREDGPAPTLAYTEAEAAMHHEPAWAARLPQMLRFLYQTH